VLAARELLGTRTSCKRRSGTSTLRQSRAVPMARLQAPMRSQQRGTVGPLRVTCMWWALWQSGLAPLMEPRILKTNTCGSLRMGQSVTILNRCIAKARAAWVTAMAAATFLLVLARRSRTFVRDVVQLSEIV